MAPYCQLIIDTPEFQRLRFIKQLGSTCYVFPSAVHTRFEHSIGVSHLASRLAESLARDNKTIEKSDIACVAIAGLCHDLGHGPFSHAFEKIVPPGKNGEKWSHEEQSVIMFEYMIAHNELRRKLKEYNIYEQEINFICEIIVGRPRGENSKLNTKFYLHQIVNNSINGVDVDKWDYVTRDALYLGMKSAFDFNRIMPFVKVYDVNRDEDKRKELCFRDKVASDLNHMFLTRRRLHYAAYQHRVSRIITIMLKDAFLAASNDLIFIGIDGKKYDLLESVQDPMAFCQVNDTILNVIMLSQGKRMEKAREIIDRIHKRQLYQCIGEYQHVDGVMHSSKGSEILEWIHNLREESPSTSSSSTSSSKSPAEEIWSQGNIEVEVSNFNYGGDDKNPLLHIPFYNKSNGSSFHLSTYKCTKYTP
eukprot:XP_011663707.1 PREDICTED: deoxynucleoside triphosphate triphosphohydrolase SAMHD1-like [Strongylocentrotus purpuratus]